MITLANAQAESRVRLPARGAYRAKSVEMLIPERLRDRHAGLRGAYIKNPQARPMGTGRELFARRMDGAEIPGGSGARVPLPTEDGMFVLVSVVDITERRRIERAAARQRDELARVSRVAMLGELSGSLAHELNQPADGNPEQCAGGAAVPRPKPAARRQARGNPHRHREKRPPCRRSDPEGAIAAPEGGGGAVPLDINEVVEESLA